MGEWEVEAVPALEGSLEVTWAMVGAATVAVGMLVVMV